MNLRPLAVCFAFAAAAVFPQAAAAAPATHPPLNPALGCRAVQGRALAAIGNALTSGSDANVLRAALAARDQLRRCGFPRDAVSAQLIAADAYGDVKEAKNRCSALRDARTRSLALHDSTRAAMIGRALAGC